MHQTIQLGLPIHGAFFGVLQMASIGRGKRSGILHMAGKDVQLSYTIHGLAFTHGSFRQEMWRSLDERCMGQKHEYAHN